MIHPSYVDLMNVVNNGVEEGETPVINSRYSIVMATARRARQLVDGDESLVEERKGEKPLSIAVEELNEGKIRILTEEEIEELSREKDKETADSVEGIAQEEAARNEEPERYTSAPRRSSFFEEDDMMLSLEEYPEDEMPDPAVQEPEE